MISASACSYQSCYYVWFFIQLSYSSAPESGNYTGRFFLEASESIHCNILLSTITVSIHSTTLLPWIIRLHPVSSSPTVRRPRGWQEGWTIVLGLRSPFAVTCVSQLGIAPASTQEGYNRTLSSQWMNNYHDQSYDQHTVKPVWKRTFSVVSQCD